MITYYLKLARKSFGKYRYYTLISVFGLVASMFSALVIAKYVGASLLMDSFHEKRDRIYSLGQEEFIDGNSQGRRNATYLGVADLALQSGAVSQVSAYYQRGQSLVFADDPVTRERKSFTENKIFTADSNFFGIFTFPFVFGDASTAFSQQNVIVITQSTSQKYFGDRNPIGETLTLRVPWGEETVYQVSGVIVDIPALSRFDFDFLTRQSGVNEVAYWDVADYSIFVIPKEPTETTQLAERLNTALAIEPQLKSRNRELQISLESLAHPQLSTVERLLVVIGIFIVLISWTNYINQVIAQSYWKMKEIAIRRVLGASSANIRAQFVVESCIMSAVCMAVVFTVYLAVEQRLLTFTGGHLLPLIDDPTNINAVFVGVFLLGALVVAVIQASIVIPSNTGPSLRDIHTTKIGSIGLRKLLVSGQFAVSTILMICVFVVSDQLNFMRTREKGFNMDAILVVGAPIVKDTTWNVKRKTLDQFKARCAELAFVTAVTSSTSVPGEEYRNETHLTPQGADTKAVIHQIGVDENFFSLYQVRFVAGTDFIHGAAAKNRSSIILNRSAARALGYSDFDQAINTKIVEHTEGEEVLFDLVGIIDDFHQTSMKYKVRPMAFKYNVSRGHCSLKLNVAGFRDGDFSNALRVIQQIWTEIYPSASFEPFLLADNFYNQDKRDETFGHLVQGFTILALMIACLGLFALSLLISAKYQREVGIRKVFGANSVDILVFFLMNYLRPLLVSVIIGLPVAVWLMETWLAGYAYRIEIGFELITGAVGSLIVISLLTVSYNTMKSAIAKPTGILRDS